MNHRNFKRLVPVFILSQITIVLLSLTVEYSLNVVFKAMELEPITQLIIALSALTFCVILLYWMYRKLMILLLMLDGAELFSKNDKRRLKQTIVKIMDDKYVGETEHAELKMYLDSTVIPYSVFQHYYDTQNTRGRQSRIRALGIYILILWVHITLKFKNFRVTDSSKER